MDSQAAVYLQTRRLPVAGGGLACPRLGVVVLDRCLECPSLVRLEGGDPLRVVCRAGSRPPTAVDWEIGEDWRGW